MMMSIILPAYAGYNLKGTCEKKDKQGAVQAPFCVVQKKGKNDFLNSKNPEHDFSIPVRLLN